jgi:hypothetical protein
MNKLITKGMVHMPLKSTQTNKYETACFIQESPVDSEMDRNGYTVKQSVFGTPYCEFEGTLQTFNCYNRMGRRYDGNEIDRRVKEDERIQTLIRQNKFFGEDNHPAANIKGEQLSDIRMTIPDPHNSAHSMRNLRLEGDRYRAHITTHPKTESGQRVTSEIIDLGAVPSFSVRLLGNMIPNARPNSPNIRVNKIITWDMVSFPSHRDADADIAPRSFNESYQMNLEGDENGYGRVVFLQELAKYCADKDENMNVIMESFEISMDEITGIANGNIIIDSHDRSRIAVPLKGDTYREAMNILRGGR